MWIHLLLWFNIHEKKVKVKVTLVQALRLCTGRTAHRGSRGIALLFHDQRYKKGVRGQRHAPAALYPPGKTRYLLYRRLGGPQGRSGQVRKISPPTGIRSTDRPARSQSLHLLSYPGPLAVRTLLVKPCSILRHSANLLPSLVNL